MRSYAIRDIFHTVQGEGANAGRVSVFVRFAGCNMWNGEPEDRNVGRGACASWCDTDFRAQNSQRMPLDEVMRRIRSAGPSRLVVLTGGEPCLQADRTLLSAIQAEGYGVAVETNGTVEPKFDINMAWLCVSPKKLANGKPPNLAIHRGNELKVILGGSPDWTDEELLELEGAGRWGHRWVHPADPIDPSFVGVSALTKGERGGELKANIDLCLDWVRRHPRWRMGFQMHKVIEVP